MPEPMNNIETLIATIADLRAERDELKHLLKKSEDNLDVMRRWWCESQDELDALKNGKTHNKPETASE